MPQKDDLKFRKPTGSVVWVPDSLYSPPQTKEGKREAPREDTELGRDSSVSTSSGSEEDLEDLILEVQDLGKREVLELSLPISSTRGKFARTRTLSPEPSKSLQNSEKKPKKNF